MRVPVRRNGAIVCLIASAFVCGGCPTDPGGDPVANQNDNTITGDATAGEQVFTTSRTTEGGADFACASCHTNDGSGNIGPDIRGTDVDHLQEHSQGDGPHPDGVKFPQLTADDYANIAAFLAEQCESDPDCMAGADEDHDHDEP